MLWVIQRTDRREVSKLLMNQPPPPPMLMMMIIDRRAKRGCHNVERSETSNEPKASETFTIRPSVAREMVIIIVDGGGGE
jgi:hypothetical protein